MVKVKICGITNLEDARFAVSAGCDALGFVFYKKSPRYIKPEKASKIIKELPKDVKKIGVFVNAKEKTIRYIANLCGLDMLQFHGDQTPQFCQRFSNYKVIKVFRIKNKIDFKKVLEYKTPAYLFDTFVPEKIGGTGKKFNWNLLRKPDKIKRPVFLSGGLNSRNAKEAIKIVRPDWVDVSSSLELRPGKKDYKKIVEFIRVVKKVIK
jgi:phosphoribosylanthranilate isomerase